MRDSFEAERPEGNHQCIVFEPLLTSILDFQAFLKPPSFPEYLLKPLLCQVLLALDYLHSEAGVIHTGKPSASQSALSCRVLTDEQFRYPSQKHHNRL